MTSATPADVVGRLTVEQKARLVGGASYWTTADLPGVPAVFLADGPHGVRRLDPANGAIAGADPATCFPPAVALGATFDVRLAERVGAAIGAEAAERGVGVVLGPGVNIKRSPLCGRNFEYVSEDPLLAGHVGAALVNGIQSAGVGACVKHFVANDQETERLRVSADIDERTLREIHLRPFQRVVTEARPWTVMSSYNRVNGTYVGEDPRLLTRVLRDEWGFDGLVMSDWLAVNDRTAALRAGLDLEMPAPGEARVRQLVGAVSSGDLPEQDLDRAAERVVALARRVHDAEGPADATDLVDHHELAREAATRAIVLLRNEPVARDGETTPAPLLPLAKDARVAVVGELARTPRYQGAGSSQVVPTRLDDALTALTQDFPDLAFAPGYALGREAGDDTALAAEAIAEASDADVVLFFAGLPDDAEAEGRDRTHIDLPTVQVDLLESVLDVNPRVVVVLSNGSVVRLPFADRVPALVEGWLLGQAGGPATADVLTGRVNPSGRLSETIPHRLADGPAYLDFPGEDLHVRYAEGVFVGHRWYDARDIDVAFPFGHGLSYTTFGYEGLTVTTGDDALRATLTVTNTGDVPGREVVQCYLGRDTSAVARPPRVLAAFDVVELEPGESRRVELTVPLGELSHWSTRDGRWVTEGGTWRVDVGASSRDVRESREVQVPGDDAVRPLTRGSTLREAAADPTAGPLVNGALEAMDEDVREMALAIPLGRMPFVPDAGVSEKQLADLIALSDGSAGRFKRTAAKVLGSVSARRRHGPR
ncbi:glycoside hydrolase family 3 C-terminal domain-containing protein [Myceligenerans xiligouense]|uniref:Beta-glucosidase n=1 Tax=Myceligenerans xiligouense TaxID=253184 RepID=A0A3N4YHQ1_9MICO|nr:glycoside hydrolase family 3 C-terminal domain-containing protein [Myceligenerans xiligouense]RPF19637.1 beta-glucosidase [Myceligenerans xiligouense]